MAFYDGNAKLEPVQVFAVAPPSYVSGILKSLPSGDKDLLERLIHYTIEYHFQFDLGAFPTFRETSVDLYSLISRRARRPQFSFATGCDTDLFMA